MIRSLVIATFILGALVSCASAATLTLPSVTIETPPSTSIACTPVSMPIVAPAAPGTVVFNCSVAPAGWVGAVSLAPGNQFVVTNLSGSTFAVAVGASALPAGTYAPGTLTSVP